VGDAAREPTHRLHLLGLPELGLAVSQRLFRLVTGRDVGGQRDDARDLPGSVAERRKRRDQVHRAAVLPQRPELEPVQDLPVHRPLKIPGPGGALSVSPNLDDAPEHFRLLPAERPLGGVIPHLDPALGVEHGN